MNATDVAMWAVAVGLLMVAIIMVGAVVFAVIHAIGEARQEAWERRQKREGKL